MVKHSFGIFLLCFVLTGCSLFSPVKTGCIKEYMVDVKPFVTKGRHTSKTIAVSTPTSNYIYQKKEMLYSTSTHQLSYFAKNYWVERPVQMLQPLIIQALQNTHHYKAVAPTIGLGRYDYLLNTQLIDFYQDFCAPGSVFKLTLRAQLVSVSTGRVVASKEFIIIEPAPFPTPYGGVIAANQATARMLEELALWSIKR